MEKNGGIGLFFDLEECKALFARFKRDEGILTHEEQRILLRLEHLLYGTLSIQEVEDLYH
jgi:hypothetical protein